MSTLALSTISNLAGTASTSSDNVIRGSAKAWVKYDGSAQTIYASYNVTSVTYLSSGRYQVNFTTAFSSANYAACVTASVDGQIGVSGAFKFGFTEQASTYLAGSCVIGTGVVGAVSNTAIISAIFTG
jgi:hypothetical protein